MNKSCKTVSFSVVGKNSEITSRTKSLDTLWRIRDTEDCLLSGMMALPAAALFARATDFGVSDLFGDEQFSAAEE